MLEKVENYIRQWKMLEKGDKVTFTYTITSNHDVYWVQVN